MWALFALVALAAGVCQRPLPLGRAVNGSSSAGCVYALDLGTSAERLWSVALTAPEPMQVELFSALGGSREKRKSRPHLLFLFSSLLSSC